MAEAMSDDDPNLGPMIGLRSLLSTLGRKRRVWLTTGSCGARRGCVHSPGGTS